MGDNRISTVPTKGLIARHAYVHDAEDIEQEWIEMMAMARHIGWVTTGISMRQTYMPRRTDEDT